METLATLKTLLEEMRKVVVQYDEAEREAHAQLEQVVRGKLMQMGAVRGVEMAIQAVASAGSATGAAAGSAADSADGGEVDELSTVG